MEEKASSTSWFSLWGPQYKEGDGKNTYFEASKQDLTKLMSDVSVVVFYFILHIRSMVEKKLFR